MIFTKSSVPVGLLLLGTCATFVHCLQADFVSFDDPRVVTENPPVLRGLTWASLRWAWTTGHFSNWHPLTWMSLMLDSSLYGDWPGGFHLTNLAIHVGNSLMLFAVAKSWTGSKLAAFTSAWLFAVHPLQVQTVMWVSERKGLLSTFFLFAFLWVYTLYFANGRARYYVAGLICYVGSLLCKQMMITLPVLLIFVDQWPLRHRLSHDQGELCQPDPLFDIGLLRQRWLEKVPLVVLALLFSGIAYLVQAQGGALGENEDFPLVQRLGTVWASIGFYLGKLLIPSGFSFHYHNDGLAPTISELLISIVALGLLLVLSARLRSRWLLFGLAWYLVALAPVSGIVQIGEHRFADRYAYVPAVGIFIAIGMGVVRVSQWAQQRGEPMLRIVTALAVAIGLLLSLLSYRESRHWRGSLTLYQRALQLDPENPVALVNVGVIRYQQGNQEDALGYFERAIKRNPGSSSAFHNKGLVLADQNRHPEAIEQYKSALSIHPRFPEAKKSLAVSLAKVGRYETAESIFRELLAAAPANPDFLQNYAAVLAQKGDFAEAAKSYQDLLTIGANHDANYYHYAETLANLGRWDSACDAYASYLKRAPQSVDGSIGLCYALGKQHRWQSGLSVLRGPMISSPNSKELLATLGWLLIQSAPDNAQARDQSYQICQRLASAPPPADLRAKVIWCQLMLAHGVTEPTSDIIGQLAPDARRVYLAEEIGMLKQGIANRGLTKSPQPQDATQ